MCFGDPYFSKDRSKVSMITPHIFRKAVTLLEPDSGINHPKAESGYEEGITWGGLTGLHQLI